MGTLIRLPNWQSRLHGWLRRVNGRAMQPGRHDCCLFGAGAIEAQTGVDIAAPWRGRYTTFAGGRRVLRRDGYADHVDLIAKTLDEAHVSEALEGDIGILPTEEGDAVAVVQGAAAYVLTASGKLGLMPMSPLTRLFKVGR